MAECGAKIQIQQKDEVMPGATERGVDITGTDHQVARAHEVRPFGMFFLLMDHVRSARLLDQMIVAKINEAAGSSRVAAIILWGAGASSRPA